MTQHDEFMHTLSAAEAYLKMAASQLNQACHHPDSYQLPLKHLRLLRTTRRNTERMHRIVESLILVATETLDPTPILPGFEDILATDSENALESPSPDDARPDPSD